MGEEVDRGGEGQKAQAGTAAPRCVVLAVCWRLVWMPYPGEPGEGLAGAGSMGLARPLVVVPVDLCQDGSGSVCQGGKWARWAEQGSSGGRGPPV